MAFKGYKNVWGNCSRNIGGNLGKEGGNEGRRGSFKADGCWMGGNRQEDQKTSGSSTAECLASGPFGSKTDFGSSSQTSSLPAFGLQNKNSKMYCFELGSASSGSSISSSTRGSGPNSLLTFGMEPKKYSWDTTSSQTNGPSQIKSSSGGSSRNSSCQGSNSRLDWSGMVESVYREEIGRMADSYQRGTSSGFGGN
eukprot:GFUD01095428.1.p1 GENE.GFUD01095428.1~~GFUD01095428.1.p1  ORF type:complete len:203 (-),score=49.49 GFUD01095428.1:114-701(-)